MFWHMILGLLRGGEPRHGYDLITEHNTRSGNHISSGNFYRELSRLSDHGLVQTGVNPPEVDARRIPYQITEKGRHAFDQWLLSPSSQDEDFAGWLLFIERVPPETRDHLLDRRQEVLWLRSKALAQAREDALRKGRAKMGEYYDASAALILQRLKQVSAELEFLKEFRVEFDSWARSRPENVEGESMANATNPTRPLRQKGPPRK
jgi:DNA-binding PadR family transcriptional regulator